VRWRPTSGDVELAAEDRAVVVRTVEIGFLATILEVFENRSTAMIPGSRFEEEDGEPVLLVPGGRGCVPFCRGTQRQRHDARFWLRTRTSGHRDTRAEGCFEGTVAGM
jgi:hypothetical protein